MPEGFEPRLRLAAFASALPPAFLSASFVYALFALDSGYAAAWAEDAKRLVQLEFFMMLAGPLALSAATSVRDSRAPAFAAVAGAIGIALVYGVWEWSGDLTLTSAAALLLGGRTAAALLGGPARRYELFERWWCSFVVYGGLLVLVLAGGSLLTFVPSSKHWVFFCAAHYFLLACVEAVDFYPKWREPVIRRPMYYLHKPNPMAGGAVRLVFAGDAFDLASDKRVRPVVRLLALAAGVPLSVMLLMAIFSKSGFLMLAAPAFWAGALFAVFLLRTALRRGPDSLHVQVSAGEIAILEVSRGRVGRVTSVALRDIQQLEVHPTDKPPSQWAELLLHHRGALLGVPLARGLPIDRAHALQRLFELYLSMDTSSQGLQEAFAADPEMCLLAGGPQTGARIAEAAAKAPARGGITCPDCGSGIAASAPRCPYCGLLRPAL